MAAVIYYFTVRDSANSTNPGVAVTGLSPTWVSFKRLDTKAPITPQPVITEFDNGAYTFVYDAELHGDARGYIDVGANNPTGNTALSYYDRFVDIFPTREPGRITAGIDSSGHVVLSNAGLEQVVVEPGVNPRQALAVMLSSPFGLTSTTTGTVNGQSVTVTTLLSPVDGVTPRAYISTDTNGNKVKTVIDVPNLP